MKNRWNKERLVGVALVAWSLLGAAAVAQPDCTHDSARGECSPGTEAPTRQALMNGIESASPEALFTLLEYGERVECLACVPLLERRLLEDDDPRVREISAWWLRRRPIGFGQVFREIREILANDSDPVRRARAAAAIGEFMDPHGVTYLQQALADTDPRVRSAAVRGLGRLNTPAAHAAISMALDDSDAAVREAAVGQALYLNYYRDYAALIGRLNDDSAAVRRRSALALGGFEEASAVTALAALLRGDSDPMVRQAAAWALGRIGGSDAQAALREVEGSEEHPRVLDALAVARRMR